MSDSKRCIFLAGPPKAEVLNWDDTALLSDFEDSVKRFLGRKDFHLKPSPQPSSTGALPVWRSVRYDESSTRKPMVAVAGRSTSLDLTKGLRAANYLDDNDFLERSIAILEDLDATHIIGTTGENEDNHHLDIQTTGVSFATTSFTDTSTEITDSSFATTTPAKGTIAPAAFHITGDIDDLKQLPKADYIERIRPQTKTVNLLVGIVSISETRTVHLRRSNREMDIVELTVGDETRAGFCVTFWLAPSTSQKQTSSDDLRNALKRLRTGDVALLQNVALTSWRGNVYGQSLSNRRFVKNGTIIRRLDYDERPSVSTPVASKLQMVRDWVGDFIGVGHVRNGVDFNSHAGNGRRKRKVDALLLPPDTQD